MWGRWRPDADVLDAIAPDRADADRPWRNLLSQSLSARIHAALTALPEGPNRLSFFYLLGRTRGMVALLPYGLLDLRVESFCPYLDSDVLDHALSLDPVLTRLDERANALLEEEGIARRALHADTASHDLQRRGAQAPHPR